MPRSSRKQPVENLKSLWSFIMKITAKGNNMNDMQLSYKHWVSSVAIGNPERHMRKASHCGSKQQ